MKMRKFKRAFALTAVVCVCMSNTTYAESISTNQISKIAQDNFSPNETETENSTDTREVYLQEVLQDYTSKQTVSENNVSMQAVSQNEPTYDDGEYLVYVEDKVKEKTVKEIVEEATYIEGKPMEDATLYVAELTAQQAEELAIEEDVYVEKNIELEASQSRKTNSDKSYRQPQQKSSGEKSKIRDKKGKQQMDMEGFHEWNLEMIHVEGVENQKKEGTLGSEAKVKVAILDSGVELITDIPVVKSVNLVEDEQDITFYMNDMTGHGTAVADIVADINPNADIYAVRVLDSNNRATLARIIEGIRWCIDEDVDIINMSFGTSVESEILRKTIQGAYEEGILMIASAGNGGCEGVEYPAAYEEVMAVGAVDTNAVKTEESAVGEQVEIVAPGEQIKATSMLGLDTITVAPLSA